MRGTLRPGSSEMYGGVKNSLLTCHCKLLLPPRLPQVSLQQSAGRNDTLHSHPARTRGRGGGWAKASREEDREKIKTEGGKKKRKDETFVHLLDMFFFSAE